VAPLEGLARLAAQDAWLRRRGLVEEVRDLDPEGSRQPLQRRDARARAAPLEPADEALTHARGLRDIPQRQTAEDADRSEALTELGPAARAGRRRESRFSQLNSRFRDMKRLSHGGDPGVNARTRGRCGCPSYFTACFTSFVIFASSALLSLVTAKTVGHMPPESSFAGSLKPSSE